jgi:hypothetical protein
LGEDFVEKAPWRFAKTMPDEPHEYTVRGEAPDVEFEVFVHLIRGHGYSADYKGRTYTYLNVGEWRYWTMGEQVEKTTVINRAPI